MLLIDIVCLSHARIVGKRKLVNKKYQDTEDTISIEKEDFGLA